MKDMLARGTCDRMGKHIKCDKVIDFAPHVVNGNNSLNHKEESMEMKRAKWIVVTGLDGSGKTHLVHRLADYFQSKGLKVVTAHLPYDTHLQKDILPILTDRYSDRLLFALDNRIVAEKIRTWMSEYDVIISQRGWLDSYVHGACQDYSYEFINELNGFDELPQADTMIHLVAQAYVAYQRIKDDPDADKFETLRYIQKQEIMTRRAYQDLVSRHADMYPMFNAENTLIDTTYLTMDDTYEAAMKFLTSIGY